MEQKRVVIFAGGDLLPEYLLEIREHDFIIGADKGALFLIENGVIPDLSVGDFDSISETERQTVEKSSKKWVACDPVHKDLTDSELAFDLALKEQPDFILLLGVTGTRLDHTLANIQMLNRAMQHHITCAMMDKHNYITLTGSSTEVTDRGYSYVSLLPMTPEVTGITLHGFMYPLENATLKIGESLGISNQLIGSKGTVSIEGGLLLVIQSKD